MTFIIQNKGIKHLMTHLLENNDKTIENFLNIDEIDELNVCEYLAHWLDERLEDYFDTFVCLHHSSWAKDKDWKIEDNGIKELTDHLNMLADDERYEYALETVTEEDYIDQLDVCMWIEEQLEDICENALSFDRIKDYTSYN